MVEVSSSTQIILPEIAQSFLCERLALIDSEVDKSEKVLEAVRPLLETRPQCSIDKQAADDFVDEGYCSSSPTESETEFFSRPLQSLDQPDLETVPETKEISTDRLSPPPPKISVTDEKGNTELIDPHDDEHGQLWDFARDKIARRMFFVRADRRTQHMESTFYSDLYSVPNT